MHTSCAKRIRFISGYEEQMSLFDCIGNMTDSTTCSVCLEEYTEAGRRCPKLLPCSHTLCASCCWKIARRTLFQFQCPECQTAHRSPVSRFPTNRYVLQILELQRKMTESESKKHVERETIDPEQAKHQKCQVHGKSCVMFCLKRECWKTLCPKCPVQEHQEHNVVGLFECIKDSGELEKMKREVVREEKSLKACVSRLEFSKANVLNNAKQVTENIQKITAGMKKQIDEKAEELMKKVRKNSDKQVAELEAVRKVIDKECSSGKQIEREIDIRRKKNVSLSVQRLIDIKDQCDDFKKSVAQKRKMKMEYTLVRLAGHKRRKLDYSSLIGKITTKTKK